MTKGRECGTKQRHASKAAAEDHAWSLVRAGTRSGPDEGLPVLVLRVLARGTHQEEAAMTDQNQDHTAENVAAQQTTEERLARALLTLAEVESCVVKIERYLETNGRYLSLETRIPMERQTEAMRAALNAWHVDTSVLPPAECDGCLCPTEHDGDYGSSGHAGPCPPHTCGTPPGGPDA